MTTVNKIPRDATACLGVLSVLGHMWINVRNIC